jgi:hypothetical protein
MVTVQARNTLDVNGAATPSDEHSCWARVRSRGSGQRGAAPAPVPQVTAAQPCDTDPLFDAPSRGHSHRPEDAVASSCCMVRKGGGSAAGRVFGLA